MKLLEEIFVDSSAWIALADRNDRHHRAAASIFPSILQNHRRIVTSNLVIAESYIVLRKELGQREAALFLEGIKSSPKILRICSSESVEAEAEKMLLKYADQVFSYTDAVSFVIMRTRGIVKAFSFDKHFAVAGFVIVPA